MTLNFELISGFLDPGDFGYNLGSQNHEFLIPRGQIELIEGTKSLLISKIKNTDLFCLFYFVFCFFLFKF